MAKVKNKKRTSAEKVQSKKGKLNVVKPLNPFEVHVNKEKLRVIGKKQKNDRGLPGISRARAIEKRRHTLLKEYKIMGKSNQFSDKRIGEKNRSMTDDDKIMARFTAVRVKANNKKNIFNLADDEVLTHKGQTLSEIEKFDDPRSDDEDSIEDGNSGKLEKDFVAEAHFGGGMLKKTGIEGAKSHKEVIDQLIADSKKRKADKQKMKEATLELTEKLDTEWKDLIPLVNTKNKTDDDTFCKSNVDDYDKLMRELKFEARGTVSDRLKTEDEIAKEEKERLEQLERERLQRMRGFTEEIENNYKHRSADDLDDGFVTEEILEDNMLSYNEKGESNVPVNAIFKGKMLNLNGNMEDESEEKMETDSEHSKEDEECVDEEETESEDNFSDLEASTDSEEVENETDEKTSDLNEKKRNIEMENSDDEIDKEENVTKEHNIPNIYSSSDVTENINHDSESESSEDVHKEEKTIECNKSKALSTNEMINTKKDLKTDEQKIKEIMELAQKELPYTFSLPKNYESLQKTLESQSGIHQNIIIERMVKCSHPSLAEGNKDGLGLLFAYLLQYLNDLFSERLQECEIVKNFEIFIALLPRIYELVQLIPESAHSSILEVVKEKHEEYRKKNTRQPGMEVPIFLKLVGILFSTSDFRHQIVTPCFVFMEQVLTKCKVVNKSDISYGFFIVTLILEYTTMSKRYLPAAITFLSGILHMAIPKSSVRLIKVMKPFSSTSSQLVLLENFSLEKFDSTTMKVTDLFNGEFDENFKIRILYNTIKALEEFRERFSELPCKVEIFESALKYLEMIPTKNYPMTVQKSIENFIGLLKNDKDCRKLNSIVLAAKKPKALRLYEPKIEEVYDGKRYKAQSREKAERSKLMHKLKKEKKGALREIRRDKAFLGRVKINQKIQSDKERKDKVKRIYAEAAMQQSELNELDRKKKRKK